MKTLLTPAHANTKMAKDQRFESAILHLAPYKTLDGRNTCAAAHIDNSDIVRDKLENSDENLAVIFRADKDAPLPSMLWGRVVIDGDKSDLRFLDPRGVIVGLRSKGSAKTENRECWRYCLNISGRAKMPKIQAARVEKTRFFFENRSAFIAQLDKEIGALERRAARNNKPCALRLNGTSDILWERVAPQLFDKYDNIRFYDYTKIPKRKNLPSNYSLTYSLQYVRAFDGKKI
jgi:hypothetical protein